MPVPVAYPGMSDKLDPQEKPRLFTDAEKVFAFLARILERLENISDSLMQSEFTIDMYGDDPGGTTGIIGTQNQGLYHTYNGPFVITDILATWVITAVTSVTLQLGDRTLQFPPASGVQSLNALAIEMARDDQIILTVTPKQACHLEIMGNVKKRVRESTFHHV